MRTLIAVVGKGRNCPADVIDQAYIVGQRVALARHVLVTGGYAGVMVAAAHGAADAGGEVIALLPAEREVPEDFPKLAFVIRTGLSIPTRNVVVGSCCDAMIACEGSHGTMQELSVAVDRGVPVATYATARWRSVLAGIGGQQCEVDNVMELDEWLVNAWTLNG